jgi:hypothetical protein
MVEMAMESGMLQKIRSTIERCLKLWRSVNQAVAYPEQKVSGTKAITASRPSSISCAVMWETTGIWTSSQHLFQICGTREKGFARNRINRWFREFAIFQTRRLAGQFVTERRRWSLDEVIAP